MSYVKASTANPTGWRQGTYRLGDLQSGNAPDWKVAAAMLSHGQAVQRHAAAVARNRRMAHLSAIDAAARGGYIPQLTGKRNKRRLSGLGLNSINLQGQMVNGFPYVFHFSWGALGIGIDPGSIAATIAADSNFANPVAAAESGGMQVAFTYAGQGSTVANAGAEMQSVINNNPQMLGFVTTLNFYAAEGGPATQITASQPVTITAPNGTVTALAPTSAPGVAPSSLTSSFDLSNFLSGLGTGGAIALAVGAIFLLKD